ncbi:winged helix-turn-helix domain-containing protein [Rhizobium sp. BK251]|uniref:ATP-binding protein n=1 Tax=Rhizobium sp. BK251 TaxID=2512125 RepID=UPI001404C3EA|nr:winged helix-turn-helix domain-containing protein [Rhizobium sp. BK251]
MKTGDIIHFGPFRLIPSERLLLTGDGPVAIGGRALDILIALVDKAGSIVSKRELTDLVWKNVTVEDVNLRTQLSVLRRALGDGQEGVRYIINVPGKGYSFVARVRRSNAQDVARDAAPDVNALRSKIPSLPGLLVGRTDTVSQLSSLLMSRRFVSVIGPGGIGKTTVAVAVAHSLSQRFGSGAMFFVDLSSIGATDDVPTAVAQALGCFSDGWDPESEILSFLAERHTLLVIDNCEHVIDAAASLCERLFLTAPTVHLLATSREALRAEGENVHFLAALECPSEKTPNAREALASTSVQLFIHRAASCGYCTELSDDDAPIAAHICRRLNGIALAISIVASRVATYGIRGTADLLDDDTDLTLRGCRSAAPRHQTLQSMVDWSFETLSEAEQKILCKLSVFAGEFTLHAAQAVAGDPGDASDSIIKTIVSLVDKSLISISAKREATIYKLLNATRAYAARKLAQGDDEEEAARRHAGYYIDFLASAVEVHTSHDVTVVSSYAPHLDNIRKALTWSFSNPAYLLMGVDLACAAAPILLRLSRFDECEYWCRRALGALREADRGTPRERRLQEAFAMSRSCSQRSDRTAITYRPRGRGPGDAGMPTFLSEAIA